MAVEDYLEPEVAVTAVVAAAVFSPKGRQLIRRGLVYGLAGVLVAGDAITNVARGIGQGAQKVGASATEAARSTMAQAQAQANSQVNPAAPTVGTVNANGVQPATTATTQKSSKAAKTEGSKPVTETTEGQNA